MFRLTAYLNLLFNEDPMPEHVDRVAEAGLDGIELYGFDHDVVTIGERCKEHGLAFVYMSGSRPPLNHPDRSVDAINNIKRSIDLAERVDCKNINVKAGQVQDGLDKETERNSVVNVLREVAPAAESAGVTLVLEPLNTCIDHPGHSVATAAEGAEIIETVDSSSVRLLFDFYHEQIMSGDVIRSFREHLNVISHIHIADNPGRHEPGTGELNYSNIFDAIAETGYDGFVGCEFSPTGDPDKIMRDVKSLL
jgi:hydroxypyruvate isomerase